LPISSKAPLEVAFAAINVCPYTPTGNGSKMVEKQSSQWLPMSVSPGVIAPAAVFVM
jgi:hypothetical protein